MKACILADNQFVTNQGLSALCKEIGIETIVQAQTMSELQEGLRFFPDALVVLDYTLFDFASMQQMLHVKSAAKETIWLLFSNELGEHFLRYVLLSDPTINVVMKNDSKEEIMVALRNISCNIPYICEYAEQILRNNDLINNTDASSVNLTAAEKVILHEIAMGKTTKEIAYEKNLSFHTVNSHRKNIFRKLEINNVHEAVKYAIRAGIFDIAEYYI
ncbi:MAG: response regulator transcription factor [Tannerellaceae bacterium]|jgi:DNA-binding NarL/FixJ family response regulator|nr:response regulator transcription factor [Tannerellaceae bacterium]